MSKFESFASSKYSLTAALHDVTCQIEEYCAKNGYTLVNRSVPALSAIQLADSRIFYTVGVTCEFQKRTIVPMDI